MNVGELPVRSRRSGRARAARDAATVGLLLLGVFLWSADHVNVNAKAMVDNAPASLWVHAPSTAVAGQPVTVTVEAWDAYERLVCGYDAAVRAWTSDLAASPPATIRFSPSWWNQGVVEAWRFPWGDGGMRQFQVTFNSPGVQRVYVEEVGGRLAAASNPVLVFAGEEEARSTGRLYWGDVHGHQTVMCDGSGYPEEVLAYARDVALLDFAAYTQHDHFISPMHTGAAWSAFWAHSKRVLNHWNDPGEFVTLLAYEYRGGYAFDLRQGPQGSFGDVVVYSRGSDVPYYSGAWAAYDRPDELFSALKAWRAKTGTPVMAIPHHTPYGGYSVMTYDWSLHDPEIVRLVEIYSVHGSSECRASQGNPFPLRGGVDGHVVELDRPGYHVRDALNMGVRVGFVASGDSHDGHLGHSLSHTEANHLLQPPLSWDALPHLFRTHHHYPVGLVAVWAPELSREAVFDAMWNRSCYAAKGVGRPLVTLTVNGARVGGGDSVVNLGSPEAPRTVRVEAYSGAGTLSNAISRVDVVKNGVVWQSVEVNSTSFAGEWVDEEPLQGASYDPTSGEWRSDGKFYATPTAHAPADPDSLNTGGADYYYARVFEKEGGAAWIGPIWVEA
ncbi:MAG: hypothetical protein Kow0069_09240 [Promethearchaeota archaeon]